MRDRVMVVGYAFLVHTLYSHICLNCAFVYYSPMFHNFCVELIPRGIGNVFERESVVIACL